MLLVPLVNLYCRVLIVKLCKNNVSADQLNFKLGTTFPRSIMISKLLNAQERIGELGIVNFSKFGHLFHKTMRSVEEQPLERHFFY